MEGARVLIIEDNADLLNLIQMALNTKGYVTYTAENGKKGLDTIEREGLPDVILLDMKMPVMDGWEFSRKFGNDYGRSAPIVVMTAAEDSRKRAMEIGADSYIGKPFKLQALFEQIENITG